MTPRYRDSTTEAVPESCSPETGLHSVPSQERVPKMGIRYDGMKYPIVIIRCETPSHIPESAKRRLSKGRPKRTVLMYGNSTSAYGEQSVHRTAPILNQGGG